MRGSKSYVGTANLSFQRIFICGHVHFLLLAGLKPPRLHCRSVLQSPKNQLAWCDENCLE